MSRVDGGIHDRFSNEAGIAMGRKPRPAWPRRSTSGTPLARRWSGTEPGRRGPEHGRLHRRQSFASRRTVSGVRRAGCSAFMQLKGAATDSSRAQLIISLVAATATGARAAIFCATAIAPATVAVGSVEQAWRVGEAPRRAACAIAR